MTPVLYAAVDAATIHAATSVALDASALYWSIDALQSTTAMIAAEVPAEVAIVATVEAVAHTDTSAVVGNTVISSEYTSVIPATSTVYMPAVSTAVGPVEVRTTEVEVGAMGITGINTEVPVACVPV